MTPPDRGRLLFPWLRGYEPAWIPRDALAGLLLASYLVPVSIAYASLAGLPPQAGLYSSMLAGLGFAAFTSGRHTSIAVTSAISLLTGSVLGELADGDAELRLANARSWLRDSLHAAGADREPFGGEPGLGIEENLAGVKS